MQFTVSSIQLPRFQGSVDLPLRVSLVDTESTYEVDAAEISYKVTEAILWDELELSLTSQTNSAPTHLTVHFSKT